MDQDRTMLDYVEKLTLRPSEMIESDVERLRVAGFNDTAILDICQIAAYYAYVNRLADGLGVEIEAYWTEEKLTMTRREFDQRKAERAP